MLTIADLMATPHPMQFPLSSSCVCRHERASLQPPCDRCPAIHPTMITNQRVYTTFIYFDHIVAHVCKHVCAYTTSNTHPNKPHSIATAHQIAPVIKRIGIEIKIATNQKKHLHTTCARRDSMLIYPLLCVVEFILAKKVVERR